MFRLDSYEQITMWFFNQGLSNFIYALKLLEYFYISSKITKCLNAFFLLILFIYSFIFTKRKDIFIKYITKQLLVYKAESSINRTFFTDIYWLWKNTTEKIICPQHNLLHAVYISPMFRKLVDNFFKETLTLHRQSISLGFRNFFNLFDAIKK